MCVIFLRAYFHIHKYIVQSHSLVLLCDISQTIISTNLTLGQLFIYGTDLNIYSIRRGDKEDESNGL